MKSVKEAADAYAINKHPVVIGRRSATSENFIAGHDHAISEFSVFEARSVYIPESNDGNFILNAYVLKPSEDFVKNHGEFIQYIELLPFSAMLAKKDAELEDITHRYNALSLANAELTAEVERLRVEAEKPITLANENKKLRQMADEPIDEKESAK